MKSIRRLFSKRRYDYQRALKEASSGMVQVTDPELLLSMIAQFIDLRIQARRAGFLILEEEKNRYVYKASKGMEKIPLGLVKLEVNSPLIQWFTEESNPPLVKRDVLVYEDLKNWLEDKKFLGKNETLGVKLERIKEEMDRFKAAVCIPSFYKKRLLGILVVGAKLSGERFSEEDLDILITFANNAAMGVRNAQLFEGLRKANIDLKEKIDEIEKFRIKEQENYFQAVLALAETVDARDPYTQDHLEKVTQYGMRTAEELYRSRGLTMGEDFKRTLRTALRLHDIGKLGMSDSILHKPGPLNEKEWARMRQHAEIGTRILKPLKSLDKVAHIIRHHHENFDGSGYPDGLKKEEIPIEARIVAVVDAYHAMISTRPYRTKLLRSKAIEELSSNAGTQFDPEVVTAFLKVYRKS